MREAELQRILTALDRESIPVLLMKGAALAYTHYPQPYLRPRRDTDLLVRQEDVGAVRRVMAEHGYAPPAYPEGVHVIQQFHCSRTDRYGAHHTFDVHWKIANTRVFADLLSFDDLHSRSVVVPRLPAPVRAPCPVDALLLACIHRVAHHNDRGDLIWVYDIHLLAAGLTPAEFHAFDARAAEKQVKAICARGLALARRWFHTPLPACATQWLDDHGREEPMREATAAFLREEQRQVDIFISDLRAVSGWCERLQFMREHALPSASFMLRSYGVSSRVLLPALYTHRIARGAWRWFRRLDSTTS